MLETNIINQPLNVGSGVVRIAFLTFSPPSSATLSFSNKNILKRLIVWPYYNQGK
jgi:hypothetical protein